MDTLIGVKNIARLPLAKRDLLFFDKILVPQLHVDIESADAALRADLEWLVGAGMVAESADPVASHAEVAATDPLTPALHRLALLAYEHAGVLGPAMGMEPASVRASATEAGSVLGTRIVAAHTQQVQGIRCVPIVQSSEGGSDFDVFGTIESFLPHIVVLLDALSSGAIRLAPPPGMEPSDELTAMYVAWMGGAVEEILASQSAGAVPASPVLDIVVKMLPIPDESVPWEKIRDFRDNADARTNLLGLRQWMRKVAAADTPAVEIREEIEFLRASFDSHMRFHAMKSRPGVLRTLVALPAAVGNALKLDFAGAVDALLAGKTREIALLEAERSAPGRELAFISNATEKFG
ncbi:MAG TPA: hypothetical protein VF625_13300 [Longimicrobium sp.]